MLSVKNSLVTHNPLLTRKQEHGSRSENRVSDAVRFCSGPSDSAQSRRPSRSEYALKKNHHGVNGHGKGHKKLRHAHDKTKAVAEEEEVPDSGDNENEAEPDVAPSTFSYSFA